MSITTHTDPGGKCLCVAKLSSALLMLLPTEIRFPVKGIFLPWSSINSFAGYVHSERVNTVVSPGARSFTKERTDFLKDAGNLDTTCGGRSPRPRVRAAKGGETTCPP